MTVLTIPRKKFEKEIGKLNENMQEKIALFGTPIENLSSDEIQIELFPNRPDLLSYQNYKDAFLSYLGKNTGLKKIKINKPEKDFVVNIDSSVNNVRPYTVCAIVKNLKFDDDKIKEIIEIQEKLHLTLGRKRKKAAIGIYPLESIKLPINYKAMDPNKIKFQPLEFPKEITGKQILSKHPAGRDYGDLLKSYDKFPVFLDSNNEIMSMPPIINSNKTGRITNKTKDIFIECSGFDLNILNKILKIIVSSLHFMGGKVYQMKLNYGSKKIITPDFSIEKMKLSLNNVNKLLGLDLKENQVKKYLEMMGHGYSKNSVQVSSTRTDILHEVDLIEDIAIAYGYDKIVPKIPEISTIGEIDRKEVLKKKIAEILVGLGLIETSSYHLITKDNIVKMGYNVKDFVKVKNSKTEYEFLRKDLASYMMKIFGENIDVEYPHEIFQIGKVFENYSESERLSIAITPGNFTKLKQILEYLSRMLDIKLDLENSKESPGYFIEGRTARVIFNEKEIGFIGEVHPKILDKFKLKFPAGLLEISLDEILKELG